VGDFVDGETVMMSNQQSGIEVERKTNEIVQGMFELKYLVLFTKCTNLCTSIQIFLKNDYPLVLRYMVANLGEVRLVLAPQKQKTDLPGRPSK
jgi:proliferating cell nuclear antigen